VNDKVPRDSAGHRLFFIYGHFYFVAQILGNDTLAVHPVAGWPDEMSFDE
jgi:hypothetical protein